MRAMLKTLSVLALATALSGCLTNRAAEAAHKAAAINPAQPTAGMVNVYGEPAKAPPPGTKAIVLDFWASWCAPCRQGLPLLDSTYRQFKNDGLHVVAVSVDDNIKLARRFAAEMRMQLPTAYDDGSVLANHFGVRGLPTTILLAPDGTLVYRTAGFDHASHERLESHIRHLLDTP